MAMELRISIADHDAILHAAASAREEICGLLLGEGTSVTQLVPCANVAVDKARWFEIDPAMLLAAHRAARAGGPAVIGHYHSHPSGRAEPSPRDAAAALPDGAIWLIAAAGTLTAWRATTDGMLHARFDPLVIHPVASACMALG